MSARGKSYVWAIAGMVPVVVIGQVITGGGVWLWVLAAAVVWQHLAASLAERAQQAPEVANRERRIRFLNEDLYSAQDRYVTQARAYSRYVAKNEALIERLRRELADRDERLLAAETAGVESLIQDLASGGALGGEAAG